MKGGKKKNSGIPAATDTRIPPSEASGAGSSRSDLRELDLEASEHQERDEAPEDAGSEGEEEPEEEEEESEELQIEEGDGEAENEKPKLAEGFYEIEAVRRKRVRKLIAPHRDTVQWLRACHLNFSARVRISVASWSSLSSWVFVLPVNYVEKKAVGNRYYESSGGSSGNNLSTFTRRGWPETANTWEPVKNLMSCSDVIDAFEDSSQLGKQRSTRKRKRKSGVTQTQVKKKQQQQCSPAAATYNVPAVKVRIIEEPTPSPPLNGLKAKNRVDSNGSELNSKVDKVVNGSGLRLNFPLEETGEQNELNLKLSELKGVVSTNENPVDRSSNGLSNGFPKANGAESHQSDRCTGAKRRKSGSVRRFKQDATSGVMDDIQDALAGGPLATFVQEGNHNHEFVGSDLVCRNKPDDSKDAYTITQLIKPISYSASLSNDMQDVSVTFRAKRSDGKEMMVDNKFLKMNNPLLKYCIDSAWKSELV
ncbi:hypothetical protein RND71_007640 [Anisodus tanguticus]|uniref:Chromo shadow domain-containing protein n=1 Tax=Anisodus tanguticus TaxID=243964 RepID=A0AAE1SMB3_9SOLA|nr:hypothetical protein RND71_007640 [Anisodus tanguticus]